MEIITEIGEKIIQMRQVDDVMEKYSRFKSEIFSFLGKGQETVEIVNVRREFNLGRG